MTLYRRASLQERRSDSQLPLLAMPSYVYCNDEEIAEEGAELFNNFVLEDISRGDDLHSLEELTTQISTPAGYKNPLWAKTGRELRYMADDFAKTKENERRLLAERAASVNIAAATFQQFNDLLTELFFNGGYTQERFMVLFCFCSDLAVRGLKLGVTVYRQVVNWSVKFITDKVCKVVKTLGGWSKVLCKNGEIPIGYVVVVAAVAVVGTILVMKYWNQ